MGEFLRRPQSVFARRALFQIHLWVGVSVGLYLCVVAITGAALVFRIDMQRALHSDLLMPQSSGPLVKAAAVLDSLRNAYPDAQVAGVDAPTTSRPVYLAYVSDSKSFRTVLVDPVTAKVLGELPDKSFVRTLQDLHFNLLAGKTGELVNGFGAVCLLILCITGLVIWWQGSARWRRGFLVNWSCGFGRVTWELHSAVGIWTLLVVLVWGISALNFVFPQQFRAVVGALSPLTIKSTPKSSVVAGEVTKPGWETMIARAESLMPGQYVARVVVPSQADDAFQVLFSATQPTPVGARDLTTVYLDQYTGQQLRQPVQSEPTAGDMIMAWAGPLHVGSFGGFGVKVAWLILGLAPPLLFATGAITWWRRVVRPAYARTRNRRDAQGEALESRQA